MKSAYFHPELRKQELPKTAVEQTQVSPEEVKKVQEKIDLTICQDCKEEVAVYGDGLTWSRCAECQRKQSEPKQEVKEQQESVPQGEGRPHEIQKGLTSIVIPIYNINSMLFHYTGNAIGSIREHSLKELYEIVIVDNGSPIKPPSPKSYYADKVIINEENEGVTKAWNKGIRISQGEYIVILNNDVQVFDHWLEDMKKSLIEGNYDLLMAHPMYSLTEPFARAIESKEIRNKVIESGKYFSDFKDFSCVIFRRSLLEELGMFDERFFTYCSDTDLLRRMDEAGKRWACIEAVPTSHLISATGITISDTKDIMNQDKEEYAKKWDGKPLPEVKIEKSEIPKAPVKEAPKSDKLVRTPESGDDIFFVNNGEFHHIKDPATLHALGFDFGQEQTISMKQLTGKAKRGKQVTIDSYQEYV